MSAISGVSAAGPSALLGGARVLSTNAQALRTSSGSLSRAGRSAGCSPTPQAALDAFVAMWAPALEALGEAAGELANLVATTASEFSRADGG